jgi:alpha 1,2-mannosyltransferase
MRFSYVRRTAPVHSLAVSLFLRPDQVHFFNSIGYRHEPFQMCPMPTVGTRCACSTSPDDPHNKLSFGGSKRGVASVF